MAPNRPLRTRWLALVIFVILLLAWAWALRQSMLVAERHRRELRELRRRCVEPRIY